jgi:hypothetical protein
MERSINQGKNVQYIYIRTSSRAYNARDQKNIENTTSYFYENLTRTQNKQGTYHNVGRGIAIGIS